MKHLQLTFLLLLLTMVSCDKLLEIDPPSDRLVDEVVFGSDASLNSAALSLYNTMDYESINGPLIGLYTDELKYTSANPSNVAFEANTVPANDGFLLALWRKLYSSVYQANAILQGVEGQGSLTDSVKQRAIGEACFFRALAYFNLTNLWGMVPLNLTTDVGVNSVAKKVATAEIYEQILKDLLTAKNALKPQYGNEELNRATRYAAQALLARVYLYRKDWNNASIEASAVINSGLFYPLPAAGSAFVKTNKEAFLKHWNLNGFTTFGVNYIPAGTSTPVYYLTPALINTFTAADERLLNWTKKTTVAGITYSYPYKYRLNSATSGSNAEYQVLFRLSEMFLVRSEASLELNDMESAVADINQVKSRAKIALLTPSDTKEKIMAEIVLERRREFFTEGFHRFFDLKRWGTIDAVLGLQKPNWKSTNAVLPIPLDEMQKNPNMTQNAGYP